MAHNAITLGVVATLVGPLASMGEEAVRGVELAVAEFGGQVAGKKLHFITESSSAIPDSAVQAAQKLLERDHVDLVIGPLSGNEGLAMREYARSRPDKAFVNGNSAAQDTTLRNPAPNFFRFSTDGVQWMAGLGRYAYDTLHYRNVATLAEDYSYPHAQVGGFVIEFCRVGGKIVEKFWVALGTIDYSRVFDQMPAGIDAVYVALVGTDALNFLEQYVQAGKPFPLIGGTNTLDQSVLHSTGVPPEELVGITCAGPVADDNPSPAWQQFLQAYYTHLPSGLTSPSHLTYGYYVNTKAVLLALEQINGDLSDGQSRLQAALAALEFETPTGWVRLDHNHHAIASNFVTEIAQRPDGSLYHHLVRTIPEVNQTLGIPEEDYLQMGQFNRDRPSCD